MRAVQRILPYTKQLVLYALYDVLDSEESEYDKAENGRYRRQSDRLRKSERI